jgi:hypothetical protein
LWSEYEQLPILSAKVVEAVKEANDFREKNSL